MPPDIKYTEHNLPSLGKNEKMTMSDKEIPGGNLDLSDAPAHDGIARRGLLRGGFTAFALAGVSAGEALAQGAPAQGRLRPRWLAGVPNARDIGGITNTEGRRIRTGIMFRTAALAGATPVGLANLKQAGVKTVVDFRTDGEIKAQPDPQIAGIAEERLNVFGNALGEGVADFLNTQGTAASAGAIMIKSYREMVSLDSAHSAFRRFLLLALEGKPFSFHCTEGKDRTGWGAALLLGLLSASKEQIEADYLLSNTGLIEQNAGIERHMKAVSPDINMAVLKVYLTVSPAFLNAAYDEVNTRYGSLKGYVNTALGFSDANIATLRRIYLRG